MHELGHRWTEPADSSSTVTLQPHSNETAGECRARSQSQGSRRDAEFLTSKRPQGMFEYSTSYKLALAWGLTEVRSTINKRRL